MWSTVLTIMEEHIWLIRTRTSVLGKGSFINDVTAFTALNENTFLRVKNGMLRHSLATLEGRYLLWHIVASSLRTLYLYNV